MLLLRARVGDEEVLVNARDVAEVLPYVALRDIPGRRWRDLEYHGRSVPVIDLAAIYQNQPAPTTLTTRIVLLRAPESETTPLLGVIVAKATEMKSVKTLSEDPAQVPQCAVPVRTYRDEHGNLVRLLDHRRAAQDVLV